MRRQFQDATSQLLSGVFKHDAETRLLLSEMLMKCVNRGKCERESREKLHDGGGLWGGQRSVW